MVLWAAAACSSGGRAPADPEGSDGEGAGGDAAGGDGTDATGGDGAGTTSGGSSDDTGGTGGTVPTSCGNDLTEPGEACDGGDLSKGAGSDLAPVGCSDLPGFTAGRLSCETDCSGYVVSACVKGTIHSPLADCELTTVQTAVDAASDGDTIQLPAGTCEWAQALRIQDKHVILKGAGEDRTVITRNTPNPHDKFLIQVDNDVGRPFRITGFTLRSTNADGVYGIAIDGTAKNWRVDHLRFEQLSGTQVSVFNWSYGVVDHTEHVNNVGVAVDPEEGWDDGYSAWARWPVFEITFGTADAVYVEDGRFSRDASVGASHGETVASNRGGRYVVRDSVFEDTDDLSYNTELDAHGMCNGFSRGTRSWEVYRNLFTRTGNGRTIYWRGGDGVVFDNDFEFTTGSAIELIDYRASGGDASIAGQCGYDDEYPQLGPDDYPAPDQIREAHFWGNVHGGAPVTPEVSEVPYNEDYIVEGRDYFTFERPGYQPFPYPHPIAQFDATEP